MTPSLAGGGGGVNVFKKSVLSKISKKNGYIEYAYMAFSECLYRTIDYVFPEQTIRVAQLKVSSEH
jgi:hypothetical protein